jgi:GNAT superfamily N-acetyltransferase
MSTLKVKRLVREDAKHAIKEHLLRLLVNDRYMRFCSALSDYAITSYVDKLDLTGSDVVFGVFEDMTDTDIGQHRKMVGMLHVAPDRKDSAEFALSVDADQRKLGIGDSLFERGLLHCESVGIRSVYMNCLATNVAIKKMAAKRGMVITTDRAESIARVNVNNTGSVQAFLAAAESTDLALYDINCKYARQAWDDYVAEIRKIIHK